MEWSTEGCLARFVRDEAGAVTVDWVVLTAALVGLGLAVMGVVSSGVEAAATRITTHLSTDHTTPPF
ncbi:Flp family type IVb pilin [Jannaschia sp. W003]|uniref:Flp family type IVb pilin n=1 Tax=Jannaschia sp. W003 TaxID=2867012 RepID=UPI0021A42E53|nr:hypothetical protein [Jannaschia sp. W003]UWQ20233.1 hypothetical protein K3554_09485 [Jannaschia sp. W003]